MEKQCTHKEILLPPFWGGYCIRYDTVEFWQGGKYRLHDRFIYTKARDNNWKIQRLSP